MFHPIRAAKAWLKSTIETTVKTEIQRFTEEATARIAANLSVTSNLLANRTEVFEATARETLERATAEHYKSVESSLCNMVGSWISTPRVNCQDCKRLAHSYQRIMGQVICLDCLSRHVQASQAAGKKA